MEHRHREILRERFGTAVRTVKIEVLDIPDDFEFMDAGLVSLLRERVKTALGEESDDR